MAKFCTKCGRPLLDGQPCECSTPSRELGGPSSSSPDTVIQIDPAAVKNAFRGLKSNMGLEDDKTNPTGLYERGMRITPDSIRNNESEIPIKQYNIAILRSRLKFMRAEGRLQVTNKRVLFRATGRSMMGRTTLQHEFSIDEIAGLEARKDYRFSGLNFILGLLAINITSTLAAALLVGIYRETTVLAVILGLIGAIAALLPYFMVRKRFVIKLFTSAAGVACCAALQAHAAYSSFSSSMYGLFSGGSSSFSAWNILTVPLLIISVVAMIVNLFQVSFVPNLVFIIKTKSAMGGAIEIRRARVSGLFNLIFSSASDMEFTGYNEVLPAAETDIAITEIGAMIDDIQKLGDLGVDKWIQR